MLVCLCYMRWLFWPCWSPTLPVQMHETHKLSWMLFVSSLEKQGWEQVIKIPSGNTRLKAPNYTPAMEFLSWEKSFVMSTLVKCRLRLCKPWLVSSECRSSCVMHSAVLLFRYVIYSCASTSQPFHRPGWLLIPLGLGFLSVVWNY